MQFYKKIDLSTILIHIVFAFAILCLRFVGQQNEPYNLTLVYAVCSAGLSPLFFGFAYVLSFFFGATAPVRWLAIGQAILLYLAFLLQNKLPENTLKKSRFIPLLFRRFSQRLNEIHTNPTFIKFRIFKNSKLIILKEN